MISYIAFLRGINISGKNKVPMDELKINCEGIGFAEVKTYLNSGNVAFSCNQDDKEIITKQLEQMIKDKFDLHIPVFVISKDELQDVLHHAPGWWGNANKEVYDNLIFIMRPTTFHEVFSEIGPPRDGMEQIDNYKEAVFWSFIRKDYQKTNWWSKTASANISNMLTIRTAATVRKICRM